jgi:Family of unknown function (DUF6074)
MAHIIPFPSIRRVAYIRRHAAHMAALSPAAAERHLSRQLTIQRDTMHRRGIDRDTIEREMASLAAAIRSALWDVAVTPGGAA